MPESDNTYNPDVVALRKIVKAVEEERDALRLALMSAPPPRSDDLVPWMYEYARWYADTRSDALGKQKGQ